MRDWTAEETFLLIKEYESKRCLWDKNHANYKTSAKRTIEFRKIATKFENCTEIDVREKVRSLRNIFMEKMRAIRKAGGSRRLQPKWRFFPALRFLEGKQPSKIEPLEVRSGEDVVEEELLEELMLRETPSPTTTRPSSPKKMSVDYVLEDKRDVVKTGKPANSEEIKKYKFNKFGSFVVSSLEQLGDQDLQELAQIRIRMVLSEVSQEACNRQLLRLSETK